MVVIAVFAFAVYHPGYVLRGTMSNDKEAKVSAVSSGEE
jgi:hypothetical protein